MATDVFETAEMRRVLEKELKRPDGRSGWGYPVPDPDCPYCNKRRCPCCGKELPVKRPAWLDSPQWTLTNPLTDL